MKNLKNFRVNKQFIYSVIRFFANERNRRFVMLAWRFRSRMGILAVILLLIFLCIVCLCCFTFFSLLVQSGSVIQRELENVNNTINTTQESVSQDNNSNENDNKSQSENNSQVNSNESEKTTDALTNSNPTVAVNSQNIQLSDAYVVKVVDGDTIDVIINNETKRVRYIGVNTPEREKCFFEEAKNFNSNLVLNKKVKLEKDVSETDRYGRLLRYVYLEDGTMVNEKLVAEGYAQVNTFPPDVKYQDRFLEVQKKARDEDRGLWSRCR